MSGSKKFMMPETVAYGLWFASFIATLTLLVIVVVLLAPGWKQHLYDQWYLAYFAVTLLASIPMWISLWAGMFWFPHHVK